MMDIASTTFANGFFLQTGSEGFLCQDRYNRHGEPQKRPGQTNGYEIDHQIQKEAIDQLQQPI